MSHEPSSQPLKIGYVEFVAMIASLMALNALAIDIMLSALQAIGAALGVADPNARQLTITAYVLGFGAAHLVYGPVSDRFGRKRVLMVGLVIYALACTAAALAWSFPFLLAARFVQGIGSAATRVIAVAVIRDCYHGRRMASVMSLAMMVFMTVPILAPSLGQAVLLFAGWRAIFGLIAALAAAVTVWALLRLPETLPPERRRGLDLATVADAFRVILTERTALGYTIATALFFGSLFAFLNSSQQVYVEIYGLGAWFPVAFSASAVLIGIASFLNSRLVQRFGMRRLSHGALVGFACVSFLNLMATLVAGQPAPFPLFYALMTMGFCFFGFIGTNFNALAMEPLGHLAGTASSVLGAIQVVGGGLIGAAIGYTYDGTVLPLMLGFVLLSLASLLVVLITERGRLFRAGEPAPGVAGASSR